jgi:hypothetical protein
MFRRVPRYPWIWRQCVPPKQRHWLTILCGDITPRQQYGSSTLWERYFLKPLAVAYYATDAFLKTRTIQNSHNSRQVLKHTRDSCRTFWNSNYFKFCALSESLLIFFILHYISNSHKCNHIVFLDSKGFWRWCITHKITGFLDFFHRLVF